MEIRYSKNGRRIYSSEFKAKILQEISSGITPAEISRRYQLPVLTIVKWRSNAQRVDIQDLSNDSKLVESAKNEPLVPLSEYRKALEEIKNLKRSLANMTVDRDILKEAIDIAGKKKWI